MTCECVSTTRSSAAVTPICFPGCNCTSPWTTCIFRAFQWVQCICQSDWRDQKFSSRKHFCKALCKYGVLEIIKNLSIFVNIYSIYMFVTCVYIYSCVVDFACVCLSASGFYVLCVCFLVQSLAWIIKDTLYFVVNFKRQIIFQARQIIFQARYIVKTLWTHLDC